MKSLFTLAAIALLCAPHAKADEELKYSLHFGVDNQADFCKGAPDDFEVDCSPVELGSDFEAAKRKFSDYCKSGFKGILQHVTCSCDALGEDSNGHELAKHPGRKPPKFNKKAIPKIDTADLGFYSGPSNGGAMFIFKDGKPDAFSDGGNIDCENIDKYLTK